MATSIEINKTTKVVKEAMEIVSKDVRYPKVVRDGTVTINSTIKKIK